MRFAWAVPALLALLSGCARLSVSDARAVGPDSSLILGADADSCAWEVTRDGVEVARPHTRRDTVAIDGLPPGHYRVTARPSGEGRLTVDVRIEPSQVVRVHAHEGEAILEIPENLAHALALLAVSLVSCGF